LDREVPFLRPGSAFCVTGKFYEKAGIHRLNVEDFTPKIAFWPFLTGKCRVGTVPGLDLSFLWNVRLTGKCGR
jgi:hypothetical protein